MFRSGVFHLVVAAAVCVGAASSRLAAQQQKSPDQSNDQSDNFDVRSTVGDLHLGKDADAEKAGLPLYPGARPKHENDNDPLNFGVFTEAFGFKIVVAKYESDDAPAKIIDFYRGRLKKYGKVLECHTSDHGDTHADIRDHDKESKQLKCEGNNTGPVTELKVGTEDNQRAVAIEAGKGTSSFFTLVYVYARGKHADI